MNGVFKVIPFEKSVFHWTEVNKPKEICIWYEGFEFSGPIALNQIDMSSELSIRLKNQTDQSIMIVTLGLKEESSSIIVTFNETSALPPYRIDNTSRIGFVIS